MNRSKKIFVGFVIAFVIMLGYVSYDIASRTTFPGSKPQLKERILDQYSSKKDTTATKDSTDRVEVNKK